MPCASRLTMAPPKKVGNLAPFSLGLPNIKPRVAHFPEGTALLKVREYGLRLAAHQ
jgi:hypothetical protein